MGSTQRRWMVQQKAQQDEIKRKLYFIEEQNKLCHKL